MPSKAILLPGGVLPADLAYDSLIDALGDDVEAVAKDLELYAGPAPPPDYSFDHEMAAVLRTAEQAGFDRFHLLGYSAGGAFSAAFAAEHPDRLLSLALLEPAWLGNDDLSPEEEAIWEELERIAALPPEELLEAIVAIQLAPGVEPPPAPPGPPPPWMARRPPGLGIFVRTARATPLDLDSLRSFEQPVYFALGGLSNPEYYSRMAERARSIFPDLTLEVFEERHHFDPPHRIEPERIAGALRAHWSRAEA